MSAIESLQRIVNAAQNRGVSQLAAQDVRAFASLYRQAVSELAEGRARGLRPSQLNPMEALLVRAHAILYAPEPVHVGETLRASLVQFPAAVAASKRHLALALLLMLMGGVLGYLEVQRDSSSAATLLPGSSLRNAEESFQNYAAHEDGSPIRGVFYFTHNASIALNAFALGGTAGLGTAMVMVYNGVNIGATFAVVQTLASPRAFFAFILPHSGIELFSILLAAAGGLQMGDAFLRPGNRRRRDALADAARASLPLALGAAALLAVAGLVEGWISPMALPIAIKAAIGGTLDLMLIAYLWLGRVHAS